MCIQIVFCFKYIGSNKITIERIMHDHTPLKLMFKLMCLVSTLILIGMWINRYFLDEDVSYIENRSYFETEDDVIPVMSLCFEQPFEDKLFERYGKNISGWNYRKFLMGEYFHQDLLNVDYHMVSTNISEYLITYEAMVDGQYKYHNTSNSNWKDPYYTYTWIGWVWILKCFGLEITGTNVRSLSITLKRDIFQNQIRPQSGGFAVLFHYPNQILTSMNTLTRQWGKVNETDNYWTGFAVKGMDAIQYRYKSRHKNCEPDWKNFDERVLSHLIKEPQRIPFT